ncbi:MAG: hypothetical protein EKK55_02295 [Rhodocyclaceae bacterium]|nr:MAG: hypothetical protein EKK55_02295 [Rhodocyclaceae bacterium]
MDAAQYEREEVIIGQRDLAGHSAWSLTAMGLAGEAGEAIDLLKKAIHHRAKPLDRDKYMKELGDVLWYAALGLRLGEWSFAEAASRTEYLANVRALGAERLAFQLSGGVGEICRLIDDHIYKGKPLSVYLRECLIAVVTLVRAMSERAGFVFEDVMQANVEKLRARHPNGWSPESQAAKADEAPRG